MDFLNDQLFQLQSVFRMDDLEKDFGKVPSIVFSHHYLGFYFFLHKQSLIQYEKDD